MARDSLTYLNYYHIALWLSGRVDRTISERTEGGKKPSYYPQDMQLPEEEQQLLWNHFYASKETL